MKKDNRITIRVPDEIRPFLDSLENKSQFIVDCIVIQMHNPYTYSSRLYAVESKLQHLEIEKVELIKEKERLESYISEINKMTDFRPEGYDNSVNILSQLERVTDEDLRYQANVLGVSLDRLKIMLFCDGHYQRLNL